MTFNRIIGWQTVKLKFLTQRHHYIRTFREGLQSNDTLQGSFRQLRSNHDHFQQQMFF